MVFLEFIYVLFISIVVGFLFILLYWVVFLVYLFFIVGMIGFFYCVIYGVLRLFIYCRFCI